MLSIGDTTKYENEEHWSIEKVLWVDQEQNQVIVIEVTNSKNEEKKEKRKKEKLKEVKMPVVRGLSDYLRQIQEGKIQYIEIKRKIIEPLEVLSINPDLKSNTKELQKEQKKRRRMNEIRDERWDAIKELVIDEPRIYSNERGAMIRRQAHEKNVNRAYINQCLTLYWRGGKNKEALIGDYYTSRGIGSKIKHEPYGIDNNRVTKEIIELIQKCYKEYYLGVNYATLEQAYNQMLNKYFVEKYEMQQGILIPIAYKQYIPSKKQFQRWGQTKFSCKSEIQMKKGKRFYNLKGRAAIGRKARVAWGPGYRYQIDATILDIELIDEYTGEPIGKPIVYIVVDEFSRYVVSVHVGLKSASWESASMAIYNITRNHKEFASEYGVKLNEGEWEDCCLPSTLVADNAELCSYLSASMVANLWTGIDFMAPFRPDWKGIVERKMKQLNDLRIKYESGSTYGFKNERGERNPRKQAKNTLKNITAIVIREVIEMNNRYMESYDLDAQMIQESVSPIPSELWKWGMQYRTGLTHKFEQDMIIVNLMYSRTVSLSSRGIKLDHCIYTNYHLQEIGVFDEVNQKGAKQIVVHFDPRSMKHLYYVYNGEIVRLDAVDKFPFKMYFEHMENYVILKKEQDKQGKTKNRLLHGQQEALIENERETVEANISNKTIKNISENRQISMQEQREKEAFNLKTISKESTNKYRNLQNTRMRTDDEKILNMIKMIED